MGVTLFTEGWSSQVTSTTVNESSSPMISIVDDDESVRDALESLLKSVGYRTEVFASAQEFLRSGHHEDYYA